MAEHLIDDKLILGKLNTRHQQVQVTETDQEN